MERWTMDDREKTGRSRAALVLGASALVAALAPGPRAADEPGTLKGLAEARARVARNIADYYADPRLASLEGKADSRGIPGAEPVELWTRRAVDARLDASSGRDDKIAILAEDVERTKAIEARIKAIADNTVGVGKLDIFKAEFYRLDAEYRLAVEKAGQ